MSAGAEHNCGGEAGVHLKASTSTVDLARAGDDNKWDGGQLEPVHAVDNCNGTGGGLIADNNAVWFHPIVGFAVPAGLPRCELCCSHHVGCQLECCRLLRSRPRPGTA